MDLLCKSRGLYFRMKKIRLNAFGVLLCYIGLAILSGLFFTIIAFIILMAQKGGLDMASLQDGSFQASLNQNKSALMLLQTFASIGVFLVPCILVVNIFEGYSSSNSLNIKTPKWEGILLSILVLFAGVLAVSASLASLNELIPVSDYWKSMEEENLALQRFLIKGDGITDLLLSLGVVAFMPALLEELTFRGLGQHLLQRIFKNGHVAVFLQAIVFSAIHFNMHQVLPIFAIGLLFGYLTLYSQSIWYGVILHFMNNAFAVIALFYEDKYTWAKNWGEDADLNPTFIAIGLLMCLIGLWVFFRKLKHE